MPTSKRSKFQVRSDAAKQRWVRDDRKESYWRRHMDAWRNSGLSKRAYCKAHNVSESSFNAWCRELSIRDREYKPTANVDGLLKAEDFSFVPIRLVHDSTSTDAAPGALANAVVSTPDTKTQTSACVDVLVPGGAILRVTDGASLDLVSKLFSTLIRQ
jgi:hypothetical protein